MQRPVPSRTSKIVTHNVLIKNIERLKVALMSTMILIQIGLGIGCLWLKFLMIGPKKLC